jgi:DNA modification methylase
VINDTKRENSEANIEIENDSFDATREFLIHGLLGYGSLVLKPDSAMCIMVAAGGPGQLFADLIINMAPANNSSSIVFDHMVVWDKRNPGMGRRYRRGYELIVVGHPYDGTMAWHRGTYVARPNIISLPAPRKRVHPNEKPVELALEFILNHTAPDAVVLDPCCGSGSTGVAALRAGRRFIGFESEKRWFDLAQRRLSQAHAEPNLFQPQATQLVIPSSVTP